MNSAAHTRHRSSTTGACCVVRDTSAARSIARCGSPRRNSATASVRGSECESRFFGSCVPGVRLLRPLPRAERALQLGRHAGVVDAARPLQVALHLICRDRASPRRADSRRRARVIAVCAPVRRRAARRACAATSVAASKLLVRDQLAERIAERETDERAFVARRQVGSAARRSRASRATARTKSTCSSVSGIVGQRRERAALLPEHLQVVERRLVRQPAADQMAADRRSGAADAGAAMHVHAAARGQLAVDAGRGSASCAPASRARCDRGSAGADSARAARSARAAGGRTPAARPPP